MIWKRFKWTLDEKALFGDHLKVLCGYRLPMGG